MSAITLDLPDDLATVLGQLDDMTGGTFSYDRTRNRVFGSGVAKPTGGGGAMSTYDKRLIHSFDPATSQTSKVTQANPMDSGYDLARP